MIFPEHQSSRNNIRRGSTNRRLSVDLGNTTSLSSPPASHDCRSSHRSGAARMSFFQAKSIMEYVQAGDAVGLEQLLSDMSPSERELAYAAEAVADGGRTPILVAVKSGSLELIQSILKWLPEGQVREQVWIGRFYTQPRKSGVWRRLTCAGCCGPRGSDKVWHAATSVSRNDEWFVDRETTTLSESLSFFPPSRNPPRPETCSRRRTMTKAGRSSCLPLVPATRTCSQR